MRPRSRAQLRLYLWIVAASLALGAPFGYFDSVSSGGSGAHGIARGAVTGLLIGALIGALEIFALGGFCASACGACRSRCISGSARPSMPRSSGRLVRRRACRSRRFGRRPTRSVLFSVAFSVVFNVVTGANRLLGPRVLLQFVSGRYHRPRIEERVLLFIDLEILDPDRRTIGRAALSRLPQPLRRRRDRCDRGRGRRHPQICRRRGDRRVAGR